MISIRRLVLSLFALSILIHPLNAGLDEMKAQFQSFSGDEYIGSETLIARSGDDGTLIEVTIYENESGVWIKEAYPEFVQYYHCDSKYRTLEWAYEYPENKIAIGAKRIRRADANSETDTLIVNGDYMDGPVEQEYEIDSTVPWMQALDYSFTAIRPQSKHVLYQLRPRDLRPTKMILTYKRDGDYPVDEGITRAAHRLKLRVKGFWSIFWSTTFWVDKHSRTLLQKTIHTNPKLITTRLWELDARAHD